MGDATHKEQYEKWAAKNYSSWGGGLYDKMSLDYTDFCRRFVDKILGKHWISFDSAMANPKLKIITNMTRKPHPSLWHNLKDCAKKALLSLGRHVDSFVLVCQAQKQHETMLQLGDELS